MCVLIGILSTICLCMLVKVVDTQRREQVWRKLERNEINSEFEMEYALYLIILKIQSALQSDDKDSTMAFADLLLLVDIHNRSCVNYQTCPCHKKEIFQYLICNARSSQSCILEQDKINLLNNQGVGEFIKENEDIRMKLLTMLQDPSFLLNFRHQIGKLQHFLNDQNMPVDEVDEINNYENPLNNPSNEDDQKIDEKSSKRAHVEILQLKQAFLTHFCRIFFKNAFQKYPFSTKLFYMKTQFVLLCCKNRYMAETLLRQNGSQKSIMRSSSLINRISLRVNEIHTIIKINKIEEIARDTETQDSIRAIQSQSWGISMLSEDSSLLKNDVSEIKEGPFSCLQKFDPSLFLQVNLMSENFFNQIETLAVTVSHFWHMIEKNQINVQKCHKESIFLADNISKTLDVFQIIQELQEKSYGGRCCDFKILHAFALVQRYLLNDLETHDIYINKINSERQIKRLLKDSLISKVQGVDDTAFVLVKGENTHFGNIIQCNSLFRKSLGYSSNELKHMNICQIMPSMIKNWHNQFVDDFQRTARSTGILNRTNLVFLKQKNGYIIPGMMYNKFHYCLSNEFTFSCFLSFMPEIRISQNQTRPSVKVPDIMFFLCDDFEARVLDISESCMKQIGLSLTILNQSEMQLGLYSLTLEDIFPELPFERFLEIKNNQSIQTNSHSQHFEEYISIDLNIVSKLRSKNRLNGRTRHLDNEDDSETLHPARVHVHSEVYGLQKDKVMNIVAVVLVDQQEVMLNNIKQVKKRSLRANTTRVSKKAEEQRYFGGPITKLLEKINRKSIAETKNEDQLEFDHEQEGSFTSNSQSGNTSGSSETSALKQLYASAKVETPRSLILITQLIVLTFLILIGISAFNVALSLQRYDELTYEIQTVKLSYDRMQLQAKARLLLRVILTTANGYGPVTRELSLQRFYGARDMLNDSIQELKQVQEELDKGHFVFSQRFLDLATAKNVELYYLSRDNQLQIDIQAYSFSMNLYIQRLSDVVQWAMERFIGNLSIMHIGNPPLNYMPSEDERLLYFLEETASGNLRIQGRQLTDFYHEEALIMSKDVAEKTLLTIILSIVSITVVSLIITPMMCRIEMRKFIGLRFFLLVEQKNIEQLDDQVHEFLQIVFADASIHTVTTNQRNLVVKDKKLLKQLFLKSNITLVGQKTKVGNSDRKTLMSTDQLSSDNNSINQDNVSLRESAMLEHTLSKSYISQLSIDPSVISQSILSYNNPDFQSQQRLFNIGIHLNQIGNITRKKSIMNNLRKSFGFKEAQSIANQLQQNYQNQNGGSSPEFSQNRKIPKKSTKTIISDIELGVIEEKQDNFYSQDRVGGLISQGRSEHCNSQIEERKISGLDDSALISAKQDFKNHDKGIYSAQNILLPKTFVRNKESFKDIMIENLHKDTLKEELEEASHPSQSIEKVFTFINPLQKQQILEQESSNQQLSIPQSPKNDIQSSLSKFSSSEAELDVMKVMRQRTRRISQLIQKEAAHVLANPYKLKRTQETKNLSSDKSNDEIQIEDASSKESSDEQQTNIGQAILLAKKFNDINKIINKARLKTTCLILVLALAFSSYFLIGYFFSVQPFLETPEILETMDHIFSRDINLEIAISFIRDSLIKNQTEIAKEDDQLRSGADYFLGKCSVSEREYLQYRRKLPTFMSGLENYIKELETEKACSMAFENQDIEEYNNCISKYNGLMKLGLSNAISALIRHFSFESLKFETTKMRDINFLLTSLRNPATIELSDLKHYALDPILKDLKHKIVLSTQSYFSRLMNGYTGLFIAFVVITAVLLLLFVVFGYRSIKKSMWKTNLSLKILPLDFIPKESLPDIKAFYRY